MVIAFCNQKGGVGKSTTCFNVGAALSRIGRRVLLIDADPQGDISTMAGFPEVPEDMLQLYDVLHGEDIRSAIYTTDELSIIPSDDYLETAATDMLQEPRAALQEALSGVYSDFDYILIDCPPSLNILTIQALTASDGIIIPVKSDYLPLKGVARLVKTVQRVKDTFNPDLEIYGVVLTKYAGRQNLDKAVFASLHKAFGSRVYETFISKNAKLAEAPGRGESILQYSPRSKGAEQYMALAVEIDESLKGGKHGKKE